MDTEHTSPPVMEDEFERLIELSEMNLDYQEIEAYLEDLNRLAAKITQTPISFVNLIDSYTQWTVSHEGLALKQMPREESVCQYTITQQEDFEVEDLSKDNRFREMPYVKDDPNLRYYYGVPLTTGNGQNIGALCVLDKTPKTLDPEKKEFLALIADEVVKRLRFLKERNELKNKIEELQSKQKEVSHDIRGPLGGIIGMADMLREDLDTKQKEDILEMISLIKKGGESVLELADEIMDQSDADDKPGANEFSTKTFIEKLKELYASQAKVKNIDLQFINHAGDSSIFFPKAKLVQIAGNLISNSVKYTPEGGEIQVTIDILNPEEEDQALSVIVEDNGQGMTDQKKQEILSGGAQSEAGTKGEKGYGFGLKLVTHLIKKADGQLNIESEPGEGSRFSVAIPI